MLLKASILALVLVAASYAAPVEEEQDMSIFFQHVDLDARIVGGSAAPISRHRHMVGLSNGALIRSFVCGGSLISSRTVLTAAHCIAAVVSGGSLSTSLRGHVGSLQWSQGTQYAFQRGIMHGNYIASTIKNDIGLLITSANVPTSTNVATVPLSFNFQGGGISSRVAGWGRIAGGGAISSSLLEINVPTIDGNQCVRDVATASIVLNVRAPPVDPAVEICTFHAPGRGTCNGDSGSALVRVDNSQQIGIVSWGFPCARGAPDMFVRVSAFQTWINNNRV